MKRIVILLASIALLGLAACDKNTPAPAEENPAPAAMTETPKEAEPAKEAAPAAASTPTEAAPAAAPAEGAAPAEAAPAPGQ